MDIALHYFDEYVGDAVYSRLSNPFTLPSVPALSNLSTAATSSLDPKQLLSTLLHALPNVENLPRDSVLRQSVSLYVITYVGILLLYFSIATFSYYYIFDHRMKLHPRFLKNQVRQEIQFSLEAFPMLDLLTLPWFVGDVRGWSKLYDSMEEGPFGAVGGWQPWAYMLVSACAFLWFTDMCIYWVHRWLHIPVLYKKLHKPHHKWIIPTPFASHAFHPVDGYLQSVPYHLCVYLIPIHKYLFIGLFSFVNLWSIFIHDSDMICDHPLENYINGPSHHTLHHIHFNCNYGQYFTLSDKLGGSFRAPAKGEDPLLAVLANIEKKKAFAAEEEKASMAGGSPTLSANGSAFDEELMSGASSSDGSEEEEVSSEERKTQ